MLLDALQHRPHGQDLGDEAEHGPAGEHEDEPQHRVQAPVLDEERAQHAAQHSQHAGGEAEYTRRREHHVVGDADQRIDRSYRKTVGDDGSEHRLRHRLERGPPGPRSWFMDGPGADLEVRAPPYEL
jgi:hypothetical protein